ncbi:MAG: PGPGW domain-containing protein [Alphaproteobacteria bacterium]|nr:PGPGW domain-containing protein [Alphaproteobacteria bacterium]
MTDKRGNTTRHPLRRYFLLLIGWIIVVFGSTLGMLPGPGGIPIVAVGVAIILANSQWAKRAFIKLQRRYPKMMSPIRDFIRRHPNQSSRFKNLWRAMIGKPVKKRKRDTS